jgi:hypothetical protein
LAGTLVPGSKLGQSCKAGPFKRCLASSFSCSAIRRCESVRSAPGHLRRVSR